MSTFRAARPADAYALAALEERSSLATLAGIFAPYPYPSGDVLARWALLLEEPDVTAVVATEGDEVAGFAVADRTSLRHLGVAPERFGSGLADQLHEQAVASWIAAGAPRVQLWVLDANVRARRFYERHGWTADGRSQESPWLPHPVEVGYTYELAREQPSSPAALGAL